MPDLATWLSAIRHSHDRMRSLVGGLADDRIGMRSYAQEWSLAQVASHLGSQAEIFDLFLTAGLSGANAPGGEVFVAIWDHWNALPPRDQITRSVAANERLVSRLERLAPAQQWSFALSMFGTDLDLAGLAALRLGEHALHTWDIAVALDPGATLAPDAVELLVDTLPTTAARAARPVPAGEPVVVATTAPDRTFLLTLEPRVSLTPLDGEPAPGAPALTMPAEAFLRLVAGRMDPGHTPADVPESGRLDQLRTAFPGF
jgi:uncharacterized protein (TIGR03083 family)